MVVVGLGPAGPDLLTVAGAQALSRVSHRFLRTTRHPAAAVVPDALSFDRLYETAATLDDVYAGIVDSLAEAAAEHGTVLYAVPGSPLVAERTVELLREDSRVDVELVPALSFLDLAWAALGVDPLAEGVRVIDGRRFAVEAAGERGPLLVAQCDSRQVLSDIKLAADDDARWRLAAGRGDVPVTVLQRLGLPDQSVTTVAWDDLDKEVDPDHLTSIWVPTAAPPVAREVARFDQLVRTLRERCPWDREQTHRTLTRHLLEETYEVLEAIEALDIDAGEGVDDLEEELGDLLFQVVFHATLAAEEGFFTLADVARGIHDKLVHRHPHVFAGEQADTPDQVITNWEQIKQAEKGRSSLMDGIGDGLPSLLYAHKVQRKAASVGLDPLAGEEDGGLGAELFALVDRCRRAQVDPEAALRATAARFRDRFQAAEARAAERGVGIPEVWSP